VTELQQRLQQLRQAGEDNFDPVRFRFIEAMSQRAIEHADGCCGDAVAAVVEKKAMAVLREYKQDLSNKVDSEKDTRLNPVEDTPGATTLSLLKSLNSSMSMTREGSAQHPAEPVYRELKSTRLLRHSLSRIGSQKRIDLALEEAPEDSGPLNPQMLAIRSLTTMRDISPAYLNRFISYVDTLFWLEQADGKNGADRPPPL
jgi:hypothetical protein